MKIAIIGAGFSGLSVSYYLSKAGYGVTVYESGGSPGGLASGFNPGKWEWNLENHYHHFFVSDKHVLDLAGNVGQKIVFKKPLSSTYLDGNIYQLDSPISLLKFQRLNILDRLRTGVFILLLKLNPYWKPLEKITSMDFIKKSMGDNSWRVIWEPLFVKKFANYANKINASWFWARIKKRSARLGYPERGFLNFSKLIESEVKKNKGVFIYKSMVKSIERKNNSIVVSTKDGKEEFDRVVCTLSSDLFLKITNGLPKDYIEKLSGLISIGAINMVLSLKHSFLNDGSYWLNINELNYPFLALVEHTNFIDRKNYNGEHLLYIANYLPKDHKYFNYENSKLLEEFLPYLKKINSKFDEKDIKNYWVFKSPSAQPIVEIERSKIIPTFETPIEGLYLCNIEQIYPWDRGTNYSVEMAKKVSELVIKSM